MIPAPVFFFGAGDPAPSPSGKADDGALGVAAAWDRRTPEQRQERPPVPADYDFRVLYARVLRTADVAVWSGLIHDLHRRFNFVNFFLDAGAGGGGPQIRAELRKHRQAINGVTETCVPIVTRDDADTLDGHHILTMGSLRDPMVKEQWPGLLGDDMLKHALHAGLAGAFQQGLVALPPPPAEIPAAVRAAWPRERLLAAKLLDDAARQLQRITVATKPDGTPHYTTHAVPKFRSSGRDDLAMMLVYLWASFITWLRLGADYDEGLAAAGDVGFGGR